jgi:hypothetical protein
MTTETEKKPQTRKKRRSLNPDGEMATRRRAWAEFSRYVRLRDALATTQTTTCCRCITCGSLHPIEGKGAIQAGHFLPLRRDAYLFDERGVFGQCAACNIRHNGMWPAYYRALVSKFGEGVIDEMFRKWDDHATNFGPAEYHAIELKYRAKTALLRVGR